MGQSTLTLWLRQAAARSSQSSSFVAVPNLWSGASAPAAYRIQLPRGMTVEVASGFGADELGKLLEVVQGL